MRKDLERWAIYLFEKFGADKAIDYLCDQEDKASRDHRTPRQFYDMTYRLKQTFSKLKKYTLSE